MDDKKLVIVRTFDAPRERVWKAWTDPKELAAWWGPRGVTNPECEVDLNVGGTLYIVMLAGKELGALAGQRWPMKGVFKEIVPNETLTFENNAVSATGEVLIQGETTVRLENAENGKTKLTVTSYGRGMVPEAAQMLEGMEAGWNQSIDKLAEFLEK